MNKRFFIFAAVAALLVGLNACNPALLNNEDNPKEKDKDTVTGQLTPEQTKEKLMKIATGITDKFNTDDQKEAIRLFDGLYGKYMNYSFDDFENHYEHRYDELFRMPQYMRGVMNGQMRAVSDRAYTFSFEGESAIWEADDKNQKWVYKGKPSDNSVILRAKDNNGVMCEAKAWGEGQTHTYSYTWEEYHWEYPRIYLNNSNINSGSADGYYNGQYRSFSYDSYYGNWEYYDYNQYKYVHVSFATIYPYLDWFYVEDNNYYSYYNYDTNSGRFYRNDYDNGQKISDGQRTATGILPAKINFTFKHGDNELIRMELTQDMQKNDHAYFTVFARIVNLHWDADFRINSTNGSFAVAFYYGDESLISAIAHLPSYKLIDKEDYQTYEEWIEQYEDRYDELLRKVGSADAMADINGKAQVKVNVENASYVYRDLKRLDDQGISTRTQAGAQQYCNIINDGQTNGIYFNSDTKQADVRMQVREEEGWNWYWNEDIGDYYQEPYTYYDIEPVLYFPSDRTTYAFEQYFNRKPFTNLQYTIEDLANAYIRLSYYLYDEVGEVHF